MVSLKYIDAAGSQLLSISSGTHTKLVPSQPGYEFRNSIGSHARF